MSDLVTTIITFLGGGIIGASIHYASTARTERQKRHSSYIHEQLDRLYGPLYFLSGHNEKLMELSQSILQAHSERFDGARWSEDARTQETLREESTCTIELSNAYAGQVVANNEAIVSLMRENYSLVDADDVQLFLGFAIDAIRMHKEVTEGRLKGIPLEIYKAVGDISYSRPEFLERVQQRFSEKQDVLQKYH